MISGVLDASAVLAMIGGEAGSDAVAEILPQAVISAVNLAEVVSKLSERGATPEQIDEVLTRLRLSVVSFDASQARLAGLLRPRTKAAGLSLADRACLALAIERGAPAVTTDRAWTNVDVGVTTQLVRG
jgi:PIN domain nuclease of toxin-antitoxin system